MQDGQGQEMSNIYFLFLCKMIKEMRDEEKTLKIVQRIFRVIDFRTFGPSLGHTLLKRCEDASN